MSRSWKRHDKNIYKRGRMYYVIKRFGGVDYRVPAGPTVTDARKLLRKLETDYYNDRLGVRKEPKVTFNEFAKTFLEYCQENLKAPDRPALTIRRASKFFGKKYLKDITTLDIEKYKQDRRRTKQKSGKPIANSTIRKELLHLNRMFTVADHLEMVPQGYNPVKRVKKPSDTKKRVPELTFEEEKRLLDACTPQMRDIVKFAIYTGCRTGEILSLTWDRVDMERGYVYLDQTKTDEHRAVPLCRTAAEILSNIEHREGHVFLNEKGNPYKYIRPNFERAKAKAGITGLTFHDLRHVFASRLRRNGVSLGDIAELLGHKTLTMTLRYAHLSPEYLLGVVDCLDKEEEN